MSEDGSRREASLHDEPELTFAPDLTACSRLLLVMYSSGTQECHHHAEETPEVGGSSDHNLAGVSVCPLSPLSAAIPAPLSPATHRPLVQHLSAMLLVLSVSTVPPCGSQQCQHLDTTSDTSSSNEYQPHPQVSPTFHFQHEEQKHCQQIKQNMAS